jgi:hypothetical protein
VLKLIVLQKVDNWYQSVCLCFVKVDHFQKVVKSYPSVLFCAEVDRFPEGWHYSYPWVLFSVNVEVVFQKVDIIRNCHFYFIQIYHAWEGYLRKIPVERRTISRAEWRGKFSLKTGIFRKYPSQTWYICLITPNII